MVCSVEIFASLHSNVVRRQRCSPSCYGGCTYKCGFRRRMRNRPTDRGTIVSNVVRACVRNFRGTEFLFNSRDSNRRVTFISHGREIALTFLIDYCRVISTFPSNFRTRESSAFVPFARTRIIINVPCGTNFCDN